MAAPPTSEHLTAEQQAVVDDDGDRVLFSGGPGSGKTATLTARYLRLVRQHPASAVLVLCPSAAGAQRFLHAVLPHLAGGFDALPITTPWGLAHDVLSRHGAEPVVITGADQREEVSRLLAADGPARWPSAAHLVGRRAFTSEVAQAVVDLQCAALADDEILARAEAAGQRARWADLVGFVTRYRSTLQARGLVDGSGLLLAATRLLHRLDPQSADAHRFIHVIVDDAHRVTPAAAGLLEPLVAHGVTVTATTDLDGSDLSAEPWAGLARPTVSPFRLTSAFTAAADRRLVTCTHPSVEAEAVVGELLAAADEGVAWSDMAVLVRSAAGPRARSVARALSRHGIPAGPVPCASDDEPVVQAVLDVLRWVGGDGDALERLVASPVAGLDPAEVRTVRGESVNQGVPLEAHPRLAPLARLRADLVARAATATPADLAFEVWRQRLGHLVELDGGDDDRALDALVDMLEGLRRRAERRPWERLGEFLGHAHDGPPSHLWATGSPSRNMAGGDSVTVASIFAAEGRSWDTVVIAGCVEGELPRVSSRTPFFDRALLAGTPTADGGDRRRRALADERRLFAVASSRATRRLVATAAPEPGVLLSRFVEAWPPEAVRLPVAPGPPSVVLGPTRSDTGVFPDGQLRLSASQLSTYDDCPLRYAYEYGLGVRGEGNVYAALGGLVHEVLAEFCDPAGEVAWTREALQALAERLWRDDIARYRPQVEEARRDYFAMLESWWQVEGEAHVPEVLAVERRFEVEAGGHRLAGAIDRVDRADDGVGIRILDYKTGRREPRPEEVADDVQLAIYHLAAARDPDLASRGPATQLRLLYLRTMHAHDQPVTESHEQTTEARIATTADRILAEEFEPSVEANCRLCSFHRLCPLQDEGRMTGTDGP